LTIAVQESAILYTEPESSNILDVMSKKDNVSLSELIARIDVKDRVRMKDAIGRLLSVNILKYNAEGGLNWHGRIQKKKFGTQE